MMGAAQRRRERADETGATREARRAQRALMLGARLKIVQAANRSALSGASPRGVAPFSMRHAARCVSLAKRFHLVAPDVISLAGYNPDRRPR